MVKCRICHKVVKERRTFSDKTKDIYPSRHMRTDLEPCHGFYVKAIEIVEGNAIKA